MNKYLELYAADVEFPEVSGAEHLEMLKSRDKLYDLEPTLADQEKIILAHADQRLVAQAAKFYSELSRFVDFEQRRRSQQIPVARWWWYLDVIAQLPQTAPPAVKTRADTGRISKLAA